VVRLNPKDGSHGTYALNVQERLFSRQRSLRGLLRAVDERVLLRKIVAGVSIEEFIRRLDHYLRWYIEERIKMSLGGRSPMEHRRSLKCA
jgi:transposase InsO family protein